MSPIAARFASRVVQRRSVSMMTGVRRWAQSLEAHPFERIPISSNAQAGDYSKMFKRSVGGAVFFVPAIATLLGWPLLGAKFLDGHIQ